MHGVKTNFTYNLILTVSTYIVYLVIFPYVSRILGVEMIGKVGFVENTLSFFSLFATMGISVLGVREIASAGDDRNKRSEVFSSLIVLLLVQTALVLLVYLSCIFSVDKFAENRDLMLAGIFSLISTSALIEWFFRGMEDFRYIALRSLAIKLIYAVAVICLVKKPSDYLLFYVLTVLSIMVNALVNIAYSHKFVRFSFSKVKMRTFLKPFYSLGLYVIMVSMYTTFNIIFLGFVCPENEVGYYYTSIKIYAICVGLLNAYTTVMLPRMSSLISGDNLDEFKLRVKGSFELVFSTVIPIIFASVVLAPQIVFLIAGSGYEGTIMPMRIVMFVLFFSGIAQVIVVQVLMPMHKDGVILSGAVIGAVVGVSANVLLCRHLGATGSAIALLLSEILGNLFCLVYALAKGFLKFPVGTLAFHFVAGLPYLAVAFLCSYFISSASFCLAVAALFSVAYFLVLAKYRLSVNLY